jgi:hypothetical protein
MRMRMNDDFENFIIGSFLILIFILCYFTVGWTYDYISCHAKWSSSGIEASYGPLKGCTIKNKKGMFIPEKNYRDIE